MGIGFCISNGLVQPALSERFAMRTLAVAGLTAILLVLLTSILFGAAVWPGWAAALPGFSRQFAAENSEIVHLMPTVLAALLQQGVARRWRSGAMGRGGRRGGRLTSSGRVCGNSRGAGPRSLPGRRLTPCYDMPIVATAVIWFVADAIAPGGAGDRRGCRPDVGDDRADHAGGGRPAFPLAMPP
jgi:hypothetical protein